MRGDVTWASWSGSPSSTRCVRPAHRGDASASTALPSLVDDQDVDRRRGASSRALVGEGQDGSSRAGTFGSAAKAATSVALVIEGVVVADASFPADGLLALSRIRSAVLVVLSTLREAGCR